MTTRSRTMYVPQHFQASDEDLHT
ncbi:MAG: hypothetical protein QOF82_2875, partial [Frankiales bacterium]|nr:hypothetical protein [Frankiales bacterium]